MFDIGFWELIIIAVVALIVVGPERFPGMIKKVGYWVGQFRRIAASVKSEIQIEVDKAEQLQNLLDEQKQILKRNTEVDLTQPAVKLKSNSSDDSSDQQNTTPKHHQVPVPKPTPTPSPKLTPEVTESLDLENTSVPSSVSESMPGSSKPAVTGKSE